MNPNTRDTSVIALTVTSAFSRFILEAGSYWLVI
jgi:hypothetical protein